MGYYSLTTEEAKNTFPDLFEKVKENRNKSRSKHKNHPEDEYEWGIYYAVRIPSEEVYPSLECRWKYRHNSCWYESIPAPNGEYFEGPHLQHLLSYYGLEDRQKKQFEKEYNRFSGIKQEYDCYAYERSDGTTFLIVDESPIPTSNVIDGQELIFSGCPRGLFMERMKAVQIGDTFKYRRKKFKRVDPTPYKSLKMANDRLFIG